MGTTLTFAWAYGNTDSASCGVCFNNCLCNCLCNNQALGRVVPVVHLTAVYVWKLQYWTLAFPPSEDPGGSGTNPIDTIQDILECDARKLFTWIGLRGEVMDLGTVGTYKEQGSTFVPLVVMLSLWMYERLGRAAAKAKVEEEAAAAKPKADASSSPKPNTSLTNIFAWIQKQYEWIRETITDQAWFEPIFYAALVYTPVMRGQVDLVGCFYLLLLVCFTQKQSETLWWQRPMVWIAEHQMGILLIFLWVRYGVYLGRPCSEFTITSWLWSGNEMTRNSEWRVWLGIANECVTSSLSYQPCPVGDMLWTTLYC